MRCKRCGRDNPVNASRCRYCNTSLRPSTPNQRRADSGVEKGIAATIIALVVILALLAVAYAFSGFKLPTKGFKSGGGGGGGAISSGVNILPGMNPKPAKPISPETLPENPPEKDEPKDSEAEILLGTYECNLEEGLHSIIKLLPDNRFSASSTYALNDLPMPLDEYITLEGSFSYEWEIGEDTGISFIWLLLHPDDGSEEIAFMYWPDEKYFHDQWQTYYYIGK